MLSCKVGNTIIYTFNNTYDKHTLKEWSDKNRLICPDCGKPYEYCHGKIVSPYFRHKEKSECEGLYHESETEEHIKGKIALFNWLLSLQKQGLVQSVKLEAYIPETRQRPDLYFEKDGQRFVIEYQCSPIASEFLERKELYKLAKVNDIWIMGTEKYNLHIYNNYAQHYSRYKTIEKNTDYYFNINNNMLYINNKLIKKELTYKQIRLPEYISFNLNDYILDNNALFINKEILNRYKEDDYNKYLADKDRIDAENKRLAELEEKRSNIVKRVIDLYNKSNINLCVNYREATPYYNWAIDFEIITKINDINYHYNYVFFIKDNCIDFCEMNYNKPKYINLGTFNSNEITDEQISEFVYFKMSGFNSLIYKEFQCISCKAIFKINLGEVEFYKNKGFSLPKRCKSCREIRKQRRINIE